MGRLITHVLCHHAFAQPILGRIVFEYRGINSVVCGVHCIWWTLGDLHHRVPSFTVRTICSRQIYTCAIFFPFLNDGISGCWYLSSDLYFPLTLSQCSLVIFCSHCEIIVFILLFKKQLVKLIFTDCQTTCTNHLGRCWIRSVTLKGLNIVNWYYFIDLLLLWAYCKFLEAQIYYPLFHFKLKSMHSRGFCGISSGDIVLVTSL